MRGSHRAVIDGIRASLVSQYVLALGGENIMADMKRKATAKGDNATKSITFDVPSGQRLGQAIANALMRSGDWNMHENQSTMNGKQIAHSVSYLVKGRDLFYLTNSELQALVTDLATDNPDTTTKPV